jgi:flagellar hook-associated protein 2
MMMMSITFGGISSGLPVNDIIDSLITAERQPLVQIQSRIDQTQARKTALTALTTRASALKSALFKFTSTSTLEGNIFQKRTTTSSDATKATVTATEEAGVNQYKLDVSQLATSTTARSSNLVGAVATGSTKLSDIKSASFTAGKFSVYVSGVERQVTVDPATDTMGSVLSKIQALGGISSTAVTTTGQVQINSTTAGTIKFGSSGDTSNFLKLAQLDTATELTTPAGRFEGTQSFSSIDTTQSVSSTAAGFRTAVTAGSTFKIGKATFDTTGKSLNTLIAEINNSADSGVTASFDFTQNRLNLTSKTTGQTAIQMSDTTGNFLKSLQVITSTNNSLSSQTLGKNAAFRINGTTYASTSNEVTDASTGIKGLTFKLNSNITTTAPVTLDVSRDTKQLTDAVKEVVKEFNALVSAIDTETNSERGRIGAQNSIRGLRSNLRSQISSGVTGNAFGSLANVGIATGNSNGLTATATINFDEAKFTEALASNPSALSDLLKGTSGIFTKLQTVVDNAVKRGTSDNDRGLFESIENSFDSQIKRYRESITKGEERLERRRVSLRRQFAASDSLIAQYQSQGQAISSLGATLNANNGN